MRLALALAIAGLSLIGCGEFGADTPRAAWERTMQFYVSHDYGALWDSMSDESHRDTIRVLTHVKREPNYRESMRVKFQILPADLKEMSPRDFFVALMTAVERIEPKLVALRAENSRTATFSREEIDDTIAVVFWESTNGGPENMTFVKEGGRWKPVIKR